MEETYANIDYGQPVCSIPTTHPKYSSNAKKKRFYLAVIFCLGLLSVCLLAGLIVLGVHYHISGEMAANLSAIQDQLNERLQASKDNLSSLTEERNQLKANLNELTEGLNKHLSTQSVSFHVAEKWKRAPCMEKKTCPAGWRMFICSCYLLSTTSGSWDQGREDCRGRGADLVVIDSDEEQKFISEFTKGKSWIGLSDKEREGIWKWVDGTNLTLTNWNTHQPDNGGGNPEWGEEDCVQLIDYNRNAWNDVKCTASIWWICEKRPT
ncbi:CD209 antigen-like protein 2 [Melanotaenia boesemani]|uniref:CD209 antigen-like protein 2 n=1 Tax=Melanotaenia boesemani TaxID=1250792 RepID=UPI001C0492B3|nr:CD209 antigen-like protein 2 [Melanotaenia boesemani]